MNKNKVILINPHSDSPQPIMPLGLAYLGAALEKEGIGVGVIDAWAERLVPEKLLEKLRGTEEPLLVGVSVMSPTYAEARRTIQAARAAYPRAKIIVGGTHPSSLPKECLLENPEVDFVCDGEGDDLIVSLVRALEQKAPDFSPIKGLLYRSPGGGIANNGKAPGVRDLDAVGFPARHLFPLGAYESHPPYRRYKRYATMITSRGCPYRCSYCTKSVSGQNYRAMSPERVIAELEHLINDYRIRQVHFYDDDFTIRMDRAERICDAMIEKGLRVAWSCVTRVDLVNRKLLDKMRRAGCWLISYGVESGDQEILNSVNKSYTVEDIRRAFGDTRAAGIRTLGYFMSGFPGETEETLKKTMDLSFELKPDFVSWSILALYPGSSLYQQALDGKLGEQYRKLNPLSLGKGDVSSLSPFAHGHMFIYEGKLPRERILKEVEGAYKKFYLRPSYLIQFIVKLRTFVEFSSYVKAFFQYIGWKKKRR